MPVFEIMPETSTGGACFGAKPGKRFSGYGLPVRRVCDKTFSTNSKGGQVLRD